LNEGDITDKPTWFRKPPLTSQDISCLSQQYRDRLESLRAVDDLIKTVIDTLRRTNKLDNSAVIFTSDNGWFYGEHRLTGKILAYEESIRVPLFIRAPGYQAPQIAEQFVVNNDLASTIAELAGVTPLVEVDGRSLVPVIQNVNSYPWRNRIFVEYLGSSASDLEPLDGFPLPFWGIRTAPVDPRFPNRLYVAWSDGTEELYDLSMDPYQIQSVASDPSRAAEKQALRSWVDQFKSCKGATCAALESQ
jgi:arylsulfatase A-like enzyme